MKSLIDFFCRKHLLVNMITALVIMGGIFSWIHTNKEELPDITFNTVRISTNYSGASAEDVEYYVTKPIEEEIEGIDGIHRVTSVSSSGRSSVSVELEQSVEDVDKIVTEIQTQLSNVSLPSEVLDDPRVRVFETAKKAIIDIALYDGSKPLLDTPSRMALQAVARGLKSTLESQPEVFEVRQTGYLIEELTINVDPKKMAIYEIPLTDINQEIKRNNVRAPSGTLKSGQRQQVTVLTELDSKDKLDNLVVQGGFDSKAIKLSDIATITDTFEDVTTIYKVNGREALMFNVVKSSQVGILEALDKVRKVTDTYRDNALTNSSIKLAYLDDESIDVRNRLSIVSSNGILGFFLIVFTLFIFLNRRSGVWVALGIPFTLCFTLIGGYFLGYTINGITLAGIIIVLGIVVDDAIIVADNISSKISEGLPLKRAAVEGTTEVVAPILASIITTCVAFVPLLFFSGRFGNFVMFIPPVIFLMLIASLFESFFLLPSHMTLFPQKIPQAASAGKRWFIKWENTYEQLLKKLLPKRYVILSLFILMLLGAGYLVKSEFKFVMFPDEESREIVLSGSVPTATTSTETAEDIQAIEDFLGSYIGKEGIAVRSTIARGRRGDVAQENQFSITLEITPADERQKSADELITEIKDFIKTQDNLSRIRFRKRRYGQSSGSVFEVIVQENNDAKRDRLIDLVFDALDSHPDITSVEKDKIPTKKEFVIQYNQEQLKRLSVNPSNISATLRTILSGNRLHTFIRNDEEIDVRLSVDTNYQHDITSVLTVPVANNQKYLIPLNEIVTITPITAKSAIRRHAMKRSSFVYADLIKTPQMSPLEIADYFEDTVFPKLLADFPTAQLSFEGEVVDSRESKKDLIMSIIAAIGLIYVVLVVLFNSLLKPLRIMLVIPFGVIGVVLAFYLHGKTLFGFYAAIGTLGMLGVVVNDAIVMLSKLDKTTVDTSDTIAFTAKVAKTRLRAIILTTLTTVVGVMPTAYGLGGYDAMLSDMMISLAWGLLFGSIVTLILIPCFFLFEKDLKRTALSLKPAKLSLFLLVLTSLGLSAPLQASTQTISLDTFIQLATQNDRTFHTFLLDKLRLNYQHDLTVETSELLASVASDFSIDADAIQNTSTLSLEKTLPTLGQTLSLGYAYTESLSDPQVFSFAFSQDIARNAFGKSIALDTHIQSIKTDIARYQLIEAYEDYMAKLITLYYTWLRQYESYQLAQSSYIENLKVLKTVQDRQKKKVADETDVNKLKLQILAKEEQVIRFKQNYLETSLDLKRVTKLPLTDTIKPNSTIVLDTIPANLQAELRQIKATRRSFALLTLIQSQVTQQQERYARELMPSIGLSAGVVHNDSFSGTLGASFGLPLYNKKAKAQFKDAELISKRTALSSEATSDSLESNIHALHLALASQHKLVETAQRKRGLAASILSQETENYSYGKIDLNDYIQAVNRYDTTRFEEIDQKISFQQLSIEWKRLTDSLISKLD